MKKLISIVLAFMMLFSSTMTVNASETNAVSSSESMDIGTYKEANGDEMTIERIETFSNRAISLNKYTPFQFRLSRNGNFDELLTIDLSNDRVIHEYANGSREVETLSEIVTITSYTPSDNSTEEQQLYGHVASPLAGDYVDNEHFDILSNGSQAMLGGAAVYDSYSAMGNRGGYYYAPNTFGYLQRRNAGISGTSYANRFSFSAGTTIGTAVGIIVAAVTSSGLSLALGVASALVGAVIDVITYDWSVKFEKRTYKWLYRVRLNSNTGRIIYNTYRTRDYWRAYNEATGVAEYDYAGSKYNDGFLLANYELIKAAIDSYLEA